ncbi:MAG: type II toxin-antitoxin system PemK/MazF family toxin [bacterium]|nr:type II toxin-antitoxin system PemK/MazF family toxin [bacterium]MDE0290072.1 type II toxin-antitoxin system PemK/MazF family toxin [bacterium]MDE0437469.1 type II toxin-antitoxin system PemK/MazF family toxin [bacterium]
MRALPRRGDVWWYEAPDRRPRPVVVLSRNAAIPRLRRAIVAPCSTVIRNLATEVWLEPGEEPIPLPSVVQLDSVFNVSVAHLTSRLGRLSDELMRRVCTALSTAVDCR